ncbi:MAG: Trm112 family protein [Ilumatobacter sp.]
MSLSPDLLAILACPEDKGPLYHLADEELRYNPRLTRAYAVQDGIPIMLIDEATTVDAVEHERLTAKIEAEGVQPTFSPS